MSTRRLTFASLQALRIALVPSTAGVTKALSVFSVTSLIGEATWMTYAEPSTADARDSALSKSASMNSILSKSS